MSHFPPPPPLPQKVGLFRRVPPAIFPAVLGVLGLVMAWGHAVRVLGMPRSLIDLASGMVTLLFLFCFAAYFAKVIRRPGALIEDLGTLPGRTGVAAMPIGMMVLASLLAPVAAGLARLCLVAGFVILLAIALYVLPRRLTGTDTAGPTTPAMHLVFVGFILAPGAVIQLGLPTVWLMWLIAYCAFAALVVLALSVGPIITGKGAEALRPLQTIHLAPAAFIATACFLGGWDRVGAVALGISIVFAMLLAGRSRWMTAGGFSPFWSSFTFPLTAFAGALLTGYEALGNSGLRVLGGLVLVAVTLYVPVIAYRVLMMWAKGALAAKTNASIA